MCKVSVIIPYYNSEKTIIRALDSVINQTYKDIEVILIDDGSADASHSLVEDYINNHIDDYNFKHLYQQNSGPSKARNRGAAEARGKYIAFLDSDESWEKYKLETQINCIENNEDIAILGCDYNKMVDELAVKKGEGSGTLTRVGFYGRLFKSNFRTSSIIMKKEAFNKSGGFNESQRYAEDTLLILKVLRKYNGGKLDGPYVNLYKNEYGDSGLTANLKELEKWELNNFKVLRRENNLYDKKIGLLLYIIIYLFSLLKYFRRLIIINGRKRVGK